MKSKTTMLSILGISLFSFATFVVAQDKYTARFPIRGVYANPTFGMTESKKQQYEEDLISKEMCLNESLTYEESSYTVIETETYQDVILAGTRIINYPVKYTLNKFKGSSVEKTIFM